MSSLVLDGTTGELLPADPHAVGYHLLVDYDLGDAQSVTAQVASLLLDGERVTETRAGNRTITLPILVRGSDRLDLSARVDALLLDVGRSGYTLTWTPEGGLPLVWDCFVGQGTVRWDLIHEEKLVQRVDVVIPALPYGRSDAAEALTLTSVATVAARARTYAMSGLKGSARSAVSAVVSFPSAVTAWLLHAPPVDADPTAPIVAAVTGSTTPQTVTVSGAEKLRGTYTVVLGISTYNAPGQARTMTVQVAQSASSVTQTIRKAYTSAANFRPLIVGNITLPLADRPAGATVDLTFTISDTGGGGTGDTIALALMLLDSRGQTVMSLSQPAGVAGTATAWVDEPDVGAAIGPVWNATGSTRASAFAVAEPRLDGGPLAVSVASEGARLLLFGAEALPTMTAAYSPRWLAERVE